MNYLQKIEINKKNIFFLFLLFCWCSNFIIIGKFISPIKIENLISAPYLKEIRGNLSIILLALNIFFFFFLFKKKKINILIFVLFLLIFSQIIGFFNKIINYDEKYYLFSFSHIINIFNPFIICLNIYFLGKKYIKITALASIIIIFLFIVYVNINYAVRPSFNINLLEAQRITVNGLGRLYFFIYLGVLICLKKFQNNKHLNLIFYSFLSIFVIQFYFLQSRTIFLLWIIFTIYFLLINSFNLKKNLLILFFLTIVPIIYINIKYTNDKISHSKNRLYLFQGESNFKDLSQGESNFKDLFQGESNFKAENKEDLYENKIHSKSKEEYKKHINNISTGRFEKWSEAIKFLLKKKAHLFGMGPQYDRQLLRPDNINGIQGGDVSNGMLYATISGGIIGFCSYIWLIYRIFLKNIILVKDRIIKKKGIKKINNFFIFCLFSCNFLILRSIFENGFTTWGIDNILFIIFAFGAIISHKNVLK